MYEPFWIAAPPFYIVPILHYTMECAVEVRRAFLALRPDCVAVEFPGALSELFLRAASRLPDVSVITVTRGRDRLCYPIEPSDPCLEAMRSALDASIPIHCIDLQVAHYPEVPDPLPDPYSVYKIGLKSYYEAYTGCIRAATPIRAETDRRRELHMAKNLRALSYSHDTILVTVGMSHVPAILAHLRDTAYPEAVHANDAEVGLYTHPEENIRELLAECGWITRHFEAWREEARSEDLPDRQKLYLHLLQQAKIPYENATGSDMPPQAIGNILGFCKNWAYLREQLLPDLYQLLSASKSCLNHNFAYEVWKLATEYPFWKNVDGLPEISLSPQELWGASQRIRFHLKKPSEKGWMMRRLNKDRLPLKLYPPSAYSLCSYPPEDSTVERFGHFLQQKGRLIQIEEGAKTIPFSTSLEDGLDMKETIRHFPEGTLYVKTRGRPPGQMGACVVIFDEDAPEEGAQERYPWKLTWLGENQQESDMAFYATSFHTHIIGPGISRCEYGGFLLSYPPRRMLDVWHDPDYLEFSAKPDLLLAASIDYSVKPVIVYVGQRPPTPRLHAYARRQDKRILYVPMSTLPRSELKKLRTFHVLDGHEKRKIADEYIL